MRRRHSHSVVLVGWPEQLSRSLEKLIARRLLSVRTVRSVGGAIEYLDQERSCLVIAYADEGIDVPELQRRMVREGHGAVPTVLVTRARDPVSLPEGRTIAVVRALDVERLLELVQHHCPTETRASPHGRM